MWFTLFLIFHRHVAKQKSTINLSKNQDKVAFSFIWLIWKLTEKQFQADQKYFLTAFRSYSCSLNCHKCSSWIMITSLSCSDFWTRKMPLTMKKEAITLSSLSSEVKRFNKSLLTVLVQRWLKQRWLNLSQLARKIVNSKLNYLYANLTYQTRHVYFASLELN